jgi:hypothetical protein
VRRSDKEREGRRWEKERKNERKKNEGTLTSLEVTSVVVLSGDSLPFHSPTHKTQSTRPIIPP